MVDYTIEKKLGYFVIVGFSLCVTNYFSLIL